MNAFTCYLIERSMKTLAVRVSRQSENAGLIARFLQQQPMVKKVYYPGLEGSPHYDIARTQMNGFGAMLSFELADEMDANRFIKSLRFIKPAVSLGGIESTICSPAVTSHARMSAEERRRVGISDSLLRLSVGIEQVDDLLEDIESALSA